MTPYTFVEDVEAQVPVPDNGVLSRTLFNDEALKVIAFAFSAGQELSPHSAPMAAVLHFLKGDAELTLASETRNVRAGAFVHMAPGLSHGIIAKTPLVMLLYMLKQVRSEDPVKT
jgi:quercetin dioxygenase-like cupin family protein